MDLRVVFGMVTVALSSSSATSLSLPSLECEGFAGVIGTENHESVQQRLGAVPLGRLGILCTPPLSLPSSRERAMVDSRKQVRVIFA